AHNTPRLTKGTLERCIIRKQSCQHLMSVVRRGQFLYAIGGTPLANLGDPHRCCTCGCRRKRGTGSSFSDLSSPDSSRFPVGIAPGVVASAVAPQIAPSRTRPRGEARSHSGAFRSSVSRC